MRRFQDDVSSKMAEYKILLLGSYDEGCFDRLHQLKKELIHAGYKKTTLVSDMLAPEEIELLDLTDPKSYPYEKSMYGISWSSICLFVFFNDCNRESAITEMHEAVQTYDKSDCIEFLIEEKSDFRDVNLGYLKKHRISRYWFPDEENLYKTAKSKCWNHMYENDCE